MTAWYTGTVDLQGAEQGQLITHKEALMYRTAQDAPIVPTWHFGPIVVDRPAAARRYPPTFHSAPDLPAVADKNMRTV